MPHIANHIIDLGQLSELDATKRRLVSGSAELKKLTLESDAVRKRLPATVLDHYDLRVSKGKRGAAKMRNNVCGGCFISIPSGQLADLLRADVTLQVCCNCSIYILPGDPLPVAEVPVKAEKKPAVRKRKVKEVEPVAE
jgi:hypothetical protein